MKNFLSNYRGRYSRFWIERWGLIPHLPTAFDNSNSIYELLAWLQRAFTNLLADFNALEDELEDYKGALLEFVSEIVPELLRRYTDSQEFNDKIKQLIEPRLRELEDELRKNLSEEAIKKLLTEELLKKVSDMTEDYLKKLKEYDDKIAKLQEEIKEMGFLTSYTIKPDITIYGVSDQQDTLITRLEGTIPYLGSKVLGSGSTPDKGLGFYYSRVEAGGKLYEWVRPHLSGFHFNELFHGEHIFEIKETALPFSEFLKNEFKRYDISWFPVVLEKGVLGFVYLRIQEGKLYAFFNRTTDNDTKVVGNVEPVFNERIFQHSV